MIKKCNDCKFNGSGRESSCQILCQRKYLQETPYGVFEYVVPSELMGKVKHAILVSDVLKSILNKTGNCPVYQRKWWKF